MTEEQIRDAIAELRVSDAYQSEHHFEHKRAVEKMQQLYALLPGGTQVVDRLKGLGKTGR
jgi:hypothetical protein